MFFIFARANFPDSHQMNEMCIKFQFFSLGCDFWQSNYNWVVDCGNMPVEDLIRAQLKSEEEFTDQHSSHFKLCIAVNFKSL